MIKSSPIPAWRATHKLGNNNTKEVFPIVVKVLRLKSCFPAWGYGKGIGNPQGI